MSDKEKKKFEALHQKDQERHDKQLAELNEKGYFIMDDGSKSSDHVAKKKKDKKQSSKKSANSGATDSDADDAKPAK